MGPWFTDGIAEALVAFLAKAALGTLRTITRLLDGTAFVIPDVSKLPQVGVLADRSRLVVYIVFPLLILAAAAIGMSHSTLQIRYQVKDLLPRLVVGWLGAAWSVPMCVQILRFTNALLRALIVPMPGHDTSFDQLYKVIATAVGPIDADQFGDSLTAGVLQVIIAVLVAGLAAWMALTWIIRIGVLIIVVGISPLAMACYSLPILDGAARLWWRTLIGCLAIPAAQALTFSVGMWMLLDPRGGLPDHNGDDTGAQTLNLFAALAVMIFTAKIPGLVTRYLAASGAPRTSVTGAIAKVVVVSRLTRTLGRSASRRAAGRAAGRTADTATAMGADSARSSGPGRAARNGSVRSSGPGRARPPIAEGRGRDRVAARRRSRYTPPRGRDGAPLRPAPRDL